jgi:class 3 adenylate cyclase/putative methionine-R-sulfoxide reductase with GAF domain
MKRRSSAGGKPARSRRLESSKSKARSSPKALSSSLSHNGAESEVVQLREELHEAREQQTATAEVLGVISRSKFELQPVLQSVVDTALRLCRAEQAVIYRPENGVYRFAAGHSLVPDYMEIEMKTEIRPGSGTAVGRAVLTRKVARIDDALADPHYEKKADARVGGVRSMIGVPLIREGEPIGAIALARNRVEPFTDREIELVKSFAAQAVIAIENARLLNALRESLQQQTATSEVFQVVSSSPGDLEPVFATMLEKAVRICDAKFGNIYRWDGNALHLASSYNTPPAFAEARGRSPHLPAEHSSDALTSVPGRMATTKSTIHVADLAADRAYIERYPQTVAAVELGGVRTFLAIPMLKEGELIGAFALSRQEVRPFTDKQIELVKNFAAQAVIAIENARLLSELRELNQQLEQRVADQVGEIERMSRLRRFLPPQVADLIVASGTEKQLESHRREITALFCDLRGFTGFTESADAEDVIALLREYHAAIGEIIIKYSGTLERYAGDGVMVIFNDPVPVENPALQATLMALEMREAIGALTETWRRLGHDIGFGIGIAHGFATLGTIGFEGRFDYAAIGTVSNVASRLCDEAKLGQILISPRVLMAVEDAVKVESAGEFSLKGIRRPLAAYNVVALKAGIEAH